MPNNLGHEEEGMPQQRGTCGTSQGEERRGGKEKKRGHGASLCGMWSCWLDALGTLGEVPLNRYED